MDPFDEEILPFDIHEHILQYLNGSDLLKASEVSRRWNQKVESHKGFLENIKLTVTTIPPTEGVSTRSMSRISDQLSRSNIAAVLRSQRKYVNVEIRFKLLESFALRQELLQKFAGSTKYMTCDRYIYKEIPDVIFPKLTQLELIHGPNEFVWYFTGESRTYAALLPLMPAIETLRVDTLTSRDQHVISCKSVNLREVRCKRLIQTFLGFIQTSSIQQVNHNIRIITE